MLAVSDLSKTYNLQTLFSNISFSINPGEKVGLIGPNGCGKTTLLRILAGLEPSTSGRVHKPNAWRIGYLPQDFEIDPTFTLGEVIGQAAGNIQVLENEVAVAASALEKHPSDPALADRYTGLLNRIQSADPGRVAVILANLGLADLDPSLSVAHLSGGQKTRLSLATVLLNDPHAFLLDEPTNHLDIMMLQWLEGWLSQTRSAALIVSHDRTFLNHTVRRILVIDPREGQLHSYAGNYDAYFEQRQTEVDKQWSEFTDQRKEIKRMKADIARTKAQAAYTERQASSVRIGGSEMRNAGAKDYHQGIAKKVAKKAKAREKRLDRYLESDECVKKPMEDRIIRMAFDQTPHLGRSVIQLAGLDVGYDPGSPLIHFINLQVYASQRIAITGPNGCGKTTLLRTIVGELPPLNGEVFLGQSVRIGLMSQDFSALQAEKTAVENISFAFPGQTETRHFLDNFQISGDEALKPAGQLSLGQQARLMLAILVLNNCNLLILDEPINHLDILSRQKFEKALDEFKGAILMAIHDRYFISHFAQEVWNVEGGRIMVSGIKLNP